MLVDIVSDPYLNVDGHLNLMNKIRPIITWNDIWIWIIDPKFQGLDYKGLEFGGLKPGDLESFSLEFEKWYRRPKAWNFLVFNFLSFDLGWRSIGPSKGWSMTQQYVRV